MINRIAGLINILYFVFNYGVLKCLVIDRVIGLINILLCHCNA